RQKALELYNEALKLDDAQADFWIGKVYSRGGLPGPDWNALEADARRAARLDRDGPAGYSVLAFVLLYQSRQAADIPGRVAKLKEALNAYEEAFQRSSEQDKDWPTLVLNRSIASLDL